MQGALPPPSRASILHPWSLSRPLDECMFGRYQSEFEGRRIIAMESADDRAAIYALAYDEGIRVLEDQARTLEQMRVRMMTLLGTATAASAFLVGFVLKAKPVAREGLYWVGLGLGAVIFVGILVRCYQAVRPKYVWRFNLSPKVIIEGYADHDVPASLGETHKQLALVTATNIDHNDANLSRFRKWLGQALVLFLVDTLIWILLAVKVA